MDYLDKAIKGLECCIESDKEVLCPEDCPYDDDGDCRCETLVKMDALALLKEREAVEPIPFFTETGAESPNYVICGHCKSIKAIMPKYTKQKYCHECGFPVLWEGR